MDVKQRHHAQRHIVGAERVAARDVLRRDREVGVGQRHALGPSRAAAGVQHQRDVVHRRRRERPPRDRRAVDDDVTRCAPSMSTERIGTRSPAARRASSRRRAAGSALSRPCRRDKNGTRLLCSAGFSGAAVPAIDAARNATIIGSPFGSAMPTRSPRATSEAASCSATVWTCSSRSPYDTRTFKSGRTSAIASARFRSRSSIKSCIQIDLHGECRPRLNGRGRDPASRRGAPAAPRVRPVR